MARSRHTSNEAYLRVAGLAQRHTNVIEAAQRCQGPGLRAGVVSRAQAHEGSRQGSVAGAPAPLTLPRLGPRALAHITRQRRNRNILTAHEQAFLGHLAPGAAAFHAGDRALLERMLAKRRRTDAAAWLRSVEAGIAAYRGWGSATDGRGEFGSVEIEWDEGQVVLGVYLDPIGLSLSPLNALGTVDRRVLGRVMSLVDRTLLGFMRPQNLVEGMWTAGEELWERVEEVCG